MTEFEHHASCGIWLRCDVCGRFIPVTDFADGLATRKLVMPDAEYSVELFETLCKKHAKKPNES